MIDTSTLPEEWQQVIRIIRLAEQTGAIEIIPVLRRFLQQTKNDFRIDIGIAEAYPLTLINFETFIDRVENRILTRLHEQLEECITHM